MTQGFYNLGRCGRLGRQGGGVRDVGSSVKESGAAVQAHADSGSGHWQVGPAGGGCGWVESGPKERNEE